jgi:hypothetical protein
MCGGVVIFVKMRCPHQRPRTQVRQAVWHTPGCEQLTGEGIGTGKGEGSENWGGGGQSQHYRLSVLRAAHRALLVIILFSAPAQHH